MYLSGEHAFRRITNKILYARNPMIKQINNLDPNIPMWFIYGNDTWVDKIGDLAKEVRVDGNVSVKVRNCLALVKFWPTGS
jgi:hypothetical protein